MLHGLKRVNSNNVYEFLMKINQFSSCRFQCGEGFELKTKQLNLHKTCVLNEREKKN